MSQGANIVIFSCVSDGVPPPRTFWSFAGLDFKQLSPVDDRFPSRFSVQANNDLVIRNVQSSDEGVYFCFSKSPGILVNTTASLVVNSKNLFLVSYFFF